MSDLIKIQITIEFLWCQDSWAVRRRFETFLEMLNPPIKYIYVPYGPENQKVYCIYKLYINNPSNIEHALNFLKKIHPNFYIHKLEK